jgi:hypothetical protein
LDAWIGREAIALIEREGFARLPDFTGVRIGPSPREQAGKGVELRFTHHDGAHLIGALS